MKKMVFATVFIAGMLVSMCGFSQLSFGIRAGAGLHSGVYINVAPPVVYAPDYRPVYGGMYYQRPYYGRSYGRRCYRRRW